MTQWEQVSAPHTASGFSRDEIRLHKSVPVCAVLSLVFPEPKHYLGAPYFRGRALDQYSVKVVSSVLRNHSATSLAWKGLSSRSRSRLTNSVISPAVLGFLILFNAREMWSLRRRLEFGSFFIVGFTVSRN